MNKKSKNNVKDSSISLVDKELSFPGYPIYPESEDIYNRSHEEKDIDLEDLSKIKEFQIDQTNSNAEVKELDNSEYGDDLDVPGSELDDEQEGKGNEDESNNYYSIGGDNHSDLSEDQGDDSPS